jgi:hypothetical protein
MSRLKLPPLLSRLLCLQIDMQNVNLRQLSNLTSASKLSNKPEPVQIDNNFNSVQRVRFDFTYVSDFASELSWVATLATQEGNVVSVLEAVTVPAVVLNIFCLTLCFYIFDKTSLDVFRTRVFSFPSLYMKLYIFYRKYTSCYPGSNIDVSTHCFLCSFVSTTCKYNWIYRLQFWDLKSIISVLGF